jgi:hypothetical protein
VVVVLLVTVVRTGKTQNEQQLSFTGFMNDVEAGR